MSLEQTHDLRRWWDLAVAPVQAEGLRLAVELGVLDALDALEQPTPAATLAQRLQLHPVGTAHLLELLWSMGVLARDFPGGDEGQVDDDGATDDAPSYRLETGVRTYLAHGSDLSCAKAWLFRLRSMRGFVDSLGEHVRHGPSAAKLPLPADHGPSGGAAQWAAAARVQIAQEQRAVTAPAAVEVMTHLPEFDRARLLLDLGGGPGLVAIALVERHSDLQGVVFDFPETVAVAADNIAAKGLGGRLSTLGGSLATDDIGSGYDLIWCSSVLHFVPDIDVALRKILAALQPGGVLVAVQAELPQAREAARSVVPWYLPLRMLERQVTREGELAAAMARVGFERIEQFASGQFPMAVQQVVVARRAAP
ncbi:MAG: methyltransferase [Zoogloea sp.]|nr:methyltransferase [Zoogloea sp.]